MVRGEEHRDESAPFTQAGARLTLSLSPGISLSSPHRAPAAFTANHWRLEAPSPRSSGLGGTSAAAGLHIGLVRACQQTREHREFRIPSLCLQGEPRITESWNSLGWKGPYSSPCSTPCHGQGRLPLSQVAPRKTLPVLIK